MAAEASEPKVTTVAIVPARGGSKGVRGKNTARVGGVPLVARAVETAQRVDTIDLVVVSTDDESIASEARHAGADIVNRPGNLADDAATSESALLHALDELSRRGITPQVLAFMQATSPFIDAAALGRAIARVLAGDCDVVFSVFETHAFLWKDGTSGAQGINHNHAYRPRRQDREPQFQETGAFYVIDVAGFRAAKHRFFGRVGMEEVPALTAIEIDTPDELNAARMLAPLAPTSEQLRVAAVAMDFDGVHTDDLVEVDQNGRESVRVSRSDGMGISMLRAAGIPLLIISKERNPVVQARGAKLGVEVQQGIDDKLAALRDWCSRLDIELEQVAYVGNDVNDLECLSAVGWPVVVPDSHPEVLRSARIVLQHRGGHGALRELADAILGKDGNVGPV